jgi:hypothetical protein
MKVVFPPASWTCPDARKQIGNPDQLPNCHQRGAPVAFLLGIGADTVRISLQPRYLLRQCECAASIDLGFRFDSGRRNVRHMTAKGSLD